MIWRVKYKSNDVGELYKGRDDLNLSISLGPLGAYLCIYIYIIIYT